ncbi:MAG: hypothetical protein UFG06_11010 [Lachnospiraceae bacterium]|nr:hypothetical protein [Lachnospiraceae bacterium]
MDEHAIIKMKADYILFQEDEFVCVYDKKQQIVILKVKAGEGACDEAVKEELKRPHKVCWLAGQRYFKWFGAILMKYPDIFEELSEKQAERELAEADYFSVVERSRFADNFFVDADFSGTRLLFYGVNSVTVLAAKELMRYGFKEMVFIDYDASYSADGMNSFAAFGEQELKASLLLENSAIQVVSGLEEPAENEDDIYFVNGAGMSAEALLKINDYIVGHQKLCLFVNVTKKKLVIGPLVAGGESACLNCMQRDGSLSKYYPGGNAYMDSTYYHLLLFFILRTLFYIKGKNLYYLLQDAQIPINKVFTITKEDITVQVDYIYRSVGCGCN